MRTTTRTPLTIGLLLILTLLAACGGSSPSPTAGGAVGATPTAAVTLPAEGEPTEGASAPTVTGVTSSAEETPVATAAPTEGAPAEEPTTAPTEAAPEEPTAVPTAEPEPTEVVEELEPTPAPQEPSNEGEGYSGSVTGADGEPVAGAMVYVGEAMARADGRGRFVVEAPAGEKSVAAMAPGYKKYTGPIRGEDLGAIRLEPFVAKGVYVSGIGDDSVRERFFGLLDDTELNSIVINVKNDDGRVFTSQVPLARETGTSYEDFRLKEVVADLHKRGIYVIGRFTVFRDGTLPEARPELAVRSTNGGVWKDNQEHTWLDPFDRKVWEYLGDLGEEIAESGIDEIQFDYVRFPVDGDLESIEYDTPSTRVNRPKQITAFLEYMHDRLRPHGVFISADTYGLTVVSDKEQGTGQVLKNLAPYLDYYSPMIYPDHYAPGSFGYATPSAHPEEVIFQSVEQAKAKLEGTGVLVRPYLSAFRDTQYDQPFGLPQFLAQKRGADDAGSHGWIYWNAALTYPDELFRPE